MTTHVTQFGLGLCAGVTNRTMLEDAGMQARLTARAALEAQGLRPDVHACNGEPALYIGVDQGGDTILTIRTPSRIPTCPRCAVLRDAALEGRLP